MEKEETIDLATIKANIESIQIKGIRKTNDAYVKNQFEDIFKINNFEDLLKKSNEFAKRLEKLGCFKSVKVQIDSSKSKRTDCYDLNVEIEEVGNYGGGFSTSVGNNEGSLDTSFFFPNLFGKGENLRAEHSYSTSKKQDFRLSYTTPVALNPNKQFQFSAFHSESDIIWSKYKENETGISIDLKTPYKYSFKNKYQIEGKHIFSYEGNWRHLLSALDSSFDVREQSGHSLKSSLKYANQIDRRSNPILPLNGGYLNNEIELAGIGGDVRFFKANTNYLYTKTFFKYFTTQFSFSSGIVLPWKKNQKILINDKFFLGGPLTLRGFLNRGAGPQSDNCSLGNDAYYLFGVHLYTPLPFLHKSSLSKWLKTHSFINLGNLVSIDQLKTLDANNLITDCRLSVGTGLVLGFGRIARLELNYCYPIWKLQNDKHIKGLQFGIGVTFN